MIPLEELEKVSGGIDDDEALLENFKNNLRREILRYPQKLRDLIMAKVNEIIEANPDLSYLAIKDIIYYEIGNLVSGWSTGRIRI